MKRAIINVGLVAIFFATTSLSHAKVILNESLQLRASDPKDSQGKHFRSQNVHLLAGRTYTIDVSSSQFDTFVRIVNSADQVVRQNDDAGPGRNARIVFTPTKGGLYRIQATSFRAGVTGPYRLVVDRETNVVFNHQGNLTSSKTSQTFSVKLQAGRTYEITMTSPNFDTFLSLARTGMTIRSNDDNGTSRNSRIVFTPPGTQTFQVTATSFSKSATGQYSLIIED